MKAYLIDEISPSNMQKINGFLKNHATRSNLDQIFWLRIPDDLLSDIQFQHSACRPHVFAIELGGDSIKLELFIRSLKGMRCDCQAYCTDQQRDYIFNFTNGMLEQLKIGT